MSRHDTLDDLEAELRAMLRRRADDVSPDAPPWPELIRRSESVVVSLQTGKPVSPLRKTRRRVRAGWRQPSFVALAAAVMTIVGVWLLERTTSDTTEVSDLPARTLVPAPGDDGFDPATAPVVFTSDLPDPLEAAKQYLASAGIPATGAEGATFQVLSNDGRIAVVEWTRLEQGSTEPLKGTVVLRNLAAGTATGRWAVVGAVADGVELDDVRYDGLHLAFTVVNTTDDAPGSLAVTVLADGRPVSVGGQPLPQAGPADPMLGELVSIGRQHGARRTFKVELDGRPNVVIRVQHVGSRQMSVTEMALAPPPLVLSAPAGSSTATTINRPNGNDSRSDDSTPTGSNSVVTADVGTTDPPLLTTTTVEVPTTPPEPDPTTTEPPPTTLPEIEELAEGLTP